METEKKEFRQMGEKENEVLILRLTKTQKNRLKFLSEGSGFKSLSNYCRIQLLNPNLDSKINRILDLLENKKEGKNKINQTGKN